MELRVTLFEDGDPVVFAHFNALGTARARAFEARRLLTMVLSAAMSAPSVVVVKEIMPATPEIASAADPGVVGRPADADPVRSDALAGFAFGMDG